MTARLIWWQRVDQNEKTPWCERGGKFILILVSTFKFLINHDSSRSSGLLVVTENTIVRNENREAAEKHSKGKSTSREHEKAWNSIEAASKVRKEARYQKAWISCLIIGGRFYFRANKVFDFIAPLSCMTNFLCLFDRWHLVYGLWSGVCVHKHSRRDRANQFK